MKATITDMDITFVIRSSSQDPRGRSSYSMHFPHQNPGCAVITDHGTSRWLQISQCVFFQELFYLGLHSYLLDAMSEAGDLRIYSRKCRLVSRSTGKTRARFVLEMEQTSFLYGRWSLKLFEPVLEDRHGNRIREEVWAHLPESPQKQTRKKDDDDL